MKITVMIDEDVEYQSQLVGVVGMDMTQRFGERDQHGQLSVDGLEELVLKVATGESDETEAAAVEGEMQPGG